MRPQRPSNEQDRLRALRELQILDTGPEPDLDEIVELTATICGTPTCQVNLVDADRVFSKAAVNVVDPNAARDDTFCAHAILGRGLLVVNDARTDARFADNPYVVVDPGVRFYAGAPLITSDGWALGTLCVVDHEPRRLDLRQLQALRALARQVTAQLELRRYAAAAAREIARQHEMERVLEDLPMLGRSLRDPLNRLRGYLAALSDTEARPAELPAEVSAAVQTHAPEMVKLLDALLDLTGGPDDVSLERRDVDLNLVVDWAVREVRPIADAKDIVVRFDSSAAAVVHAQPSRLAQALGHLLFTAVRFTPRGGRLAVRVDNTGSPMIELHDVGAHEEPTRLYEHMLNGALRRPSGDAGQGRDSGLAVVKAILDLHHATVAMHDAGPKGTDMRVIFPPAQ
jgi:signal transduction histidine kinase